MRDFIKTLIKPITFRNASTSNKMAAPCIFALVCVIFTVFYSSPAWTEQHDIPHRGYADLQPFNASDIQKIPACQYVTGGPRIITTAPSPKIFTNVKNIYITSEVTGGHLLGQDALSLLDPKKLTLIAACTLQTQFAVKNKGGKSTSSKLIYTPNETNNVFTSPVAMENGTLIILVQAQIEDPSTLGGYDQKIMTINTRYYRHDVNDITTIRHQCSRPFPYTDDNTLTHKRLTLALKDCLNRPYVSVCEESAECNRYNKSHKN